MVLGHPVEVADIVGERRGVVDLAHALVVALERGQGDLLVPGVVGVGGVVGQQLVHQRRRCRVEHAGRVVLGLDEPHAVDGDVAGDVGGPGGAAAAQPVDLAGPTPTQHLRAKGAAVVEGPQQQVALGRAHLGRGHQRRAARSNDRGRAPRSSRARGDPPGRARRPGRRRWPARSVWSWGWPRVQADQSWSANSGVNCNSAGPMATWRASYTSIEGYTSTGWPVASIHSTTASAHRSSQQRPARMTSAVAARHVVRHRCAPPP